LGIFLLSACAPAYNPEDDLKQRAIDLAAAYFTIDYENIDYWMEEVIDEPYAAWLRHDNLLVLGKFFEARKVKSSASLISAGKIYQRTNTEGDEVIIWEIVLRIDDPWYEGGPPDPYNTDLDHLYIPWTEGEVTTVYAQSGKSDMVWFTSLIPDQKIGELIELIESQEWLEGKYRAQLQ
jgi:hypothetical protein